MNGGGSWPAKCSSGWSPLPPQTPISSPSQPQPPFSSVQTGINSILPPRFPNLHELPVFNGLNQVCSQPRPAELTSAPLPSISGKYPHFQSFSLGNLNTSNTFQVNTTDTPVASTHPFLESHGKEAQNWVLQSGFSKPGDTQSSYPVQTLDFRATQKSPSNAILSPQHGDQRLVFCMNTVGELFFDSGHLGVVCYCHRSKMSVAKFCEHSGGLSYKAGESVYMENGITISRWARFSLGVQSTQWDWPNSSSLQELATRSSSQDGSIIQSSNRIFYQDRFQKVDLTTSEANTAHENLNKYKNSLSPNCTSAAQKGKISTSIPNNLFQLISHSTHGSSFTGQGSTHESSFTGQGSTHGSSFTGQGVSFGSSARSREDISSSPSASRFELRLRQPPNLTSNSSGVIPTSVQLTPVIGVKATHFSQPAVNKDLSQNETSGPLQNPQKEDSRLNQYPANTISINTYPPSTSPSDDFASDSTKNSFISLFLSHLERKNPVEPGDDILGNGTDSLKCSDEKALDNCKNGSFRVYDGNSNMSSHLNLSLVGGFPCNVSYPSTACPTNSESLNLKHHGFELMDNSCYKPERCARVCLTTHQHGRMCCLSTLKFQNSFGQESNNKALHEELLHKSQCGNHSDVCKISVRCISSCLICSTERLSACCTCDTEKPSCISYETIPTCGLHCISRCNKRAISLLEEGKDCINGDTNKRPKLSSQLKCSWKDVPRSNLSGKDSPLKDLPDKLLIREKVISSLSSGSSAPAITELSVETDRVYEVGHAGTNVSVSVPADEASLVEKCGSSDEKHEFCTTILPSKTDKSCSLPRERAILPTDSLVKKPHKDVRLVKRGKKSLELVRNGPKNQFEIMELSMKNRKEDLLDQAVRRPDGCLGRNEVYPEKKRKEKSVYLVHCGSVSHVEINESSSEKKEESLVDQVHNGSVKYSKTSEAFTEEGEENSVALVHHRPVSCLKANVTFSKKIREDETHPVHHGLMSRLEARKEPKYKYLSQFEIKESETKSKPNYRPFWAKRNKPVVCGNYGIISNGMTNDAPKPVKIVSLNSILQRTTTKSDKIIQNNPGTTSFMGREKPRMRNFTKSTGFVHNNLKNETIMVKPTLSRSALRFKDIKLDEFGDNPGKTKRVKMKSISLDVMEREGISPSEHSAKSGAGLGQEEHNVIHPSSLPIGECQLLPASQVSKPRYAEGREHLFLSELSCSVCRRNSTEEDINKILRCQHCAIMVHQACYGISRQPKGPWFCRPCKAGFFEPVCVLCGYQGGAMTRAQKPRKLVNSLIKYFVPGFDKPSSQLYGADGNHSMVHWIHMVCGLWTPSTRCPNVNTMAVFDLSGTAPSSKKNICTVCRRPGGSCIKCRVSGCTTVFHPWCAHQKGLLQNEVEGEHSEKVGFYGMCIYHARINKSAGENLYFEANKKYTSNEGRSCARTEVFKGRKREYYANPTDNIVGKSDSRACIVSEEQINAWLRINGHKPFTTDLAMKSLSSSDIELDLEMKYMRHKQLKEWKHLVVYKSCIHSLGLYTSRFIPRGAMVVEYVGEVVGRRVADKREKEYQSGQKLHSKNSCYFFCIDKENIIDATRKGGIARFINHSCSANCVAKIISVSNEKKVVFITERDIDPGEEITYDYYLNKAKKEEKIPCSCNSKNCRGYIY